MEEFKEKDDDFKRECTKVLMKSDFAALANEQFPEINGAVEKADGDDKPAAAKKADDDGEKKDDDDKKKKKKPFSQTIPGSILDYCKRQGFWVVLTCGGSFVSQAMSRKFTSNLPLLVIERSSQTDCLWLQ
jgi:hypothetical protein